MSDKNALHAEAVRARQNAHSPYSTFSVGSALRLSNGKVYSGCNIENASYGGTVCAERVAIWKALSENPGTHIEEIVVVTDSENPWPPCGFCRQVMAEFSTPQTRIHTGNLQGLKKSFSFAEILPETFNGNFLKK